MLMLRRRICSWWGLGSRSSYTCVYNICKACAFAGMTSSSAFTRMMLASASARMMTASIFTGMPVIFAKSLWRRTCFSTKEPVFSENLFWGNLISQDLISPRNLFFSAKCCQILGNQILGNLISRNQISSRHLLFSMKLIFLRETLSNSAKCCIILWSIIPRRAFWVHEGLSDSTKTMYNSQAASSRLILPPIFIVFSLLSEPITIFVKGNKWQRNNPCLYNIYIFYLYFYSPKIRFFSWSEERN